MACVGTVSCQPQGLSLFSLGSSMAEFGALLEDYLRELTGIRKRGASEASIRDAFLRFLRVAFPGLTELQAIELEKHIPGLRVRGGYADALYGDLVFEFKRELRDASRADGKEKLTKYIANQTHPERFFGLLSDGESLEVYVLRGGVLDHSDTLRLGLDAPAHCKLWLDSYLFHEKNLTPTANDIALRFGDRSPTFWHSLRVLAGLWQRLEHDPATLTKSAEWEGLLSVVYGSSVGDPNLFLRHTYLALFARVLAFVVLEHRSPAREDLTGLLLGETFERMGFANFVEDDFFTWVSHSDTSEETRDLLQSLATRLTVSYDLSAIREDLLKELYQELVDPQTRHDLGEYYTPDWLAELVLRKAGFPPLFPERDPQAASLMDPACGSGTFLFIAIRLLREAGLHGPDLVAYCDRHLAGMDVHPLAVTIAKTNLILALGDDLRGSGRKFTLPIFMADALMEPQEAENALPISLDVDTIAKSSGKERDRKLPDTFWLPVGFAEHPGALHEAVDALLEFGDSHTDEDSARKGLDARLSALGISSKPLWQANLRLMRWLLRPPTTDTIWRFVLRNAYQPELLARRKFAFVVGNPPWLSYKDIRRRDYQARVRGLTLRYELLGRGQTHLFTQMELATLFFAFSGHRYLADSGTLAFVMPRSILTGAKQHESFRRRFVAAAKFLIDCERVAPLFNVPTCVVVWENGADSQAEPVPILILAGDLPSKNISLAEAGEHLSQTTATYARPAVAGVSPYLERVINGATIYPRCLWFVRPPETARVTHQERPQLETDPAVEPRAKKPWKGIRLSGSVEADFLFATLLSDDLLPFGWRKLSLVVLPWARDTKGSPLLLKPEGAIEIGKPGLADWLRQAEEAWHLHGKPSARVPTVYARLDYDGTLTRQDPANVFKVVYKSRGTNLFACVVNTWDVGGWRVHDVPVQGFFADHACYWLETANPDEAHFLSAILNAPAVNRSIKPFQTRGAFGERNIHRAPFQVMPIPIFDASDGQHAEIAHLSQTCHKKVAGFLADADERTRTMSVAKMRNLIRDALRTQIAAIDALAATVLRIGRQ